MSSQQFLPQLAQELKLPQSSILAVIRLFEDGNTVPFIARYRKEATGNLDEVSIRAIEERHQYLQELVERQKVIIASIESQGKLTDALKRQIVECPTKTALEDLYLPYKPKRRTRAMIAREKGLEPLALKILEQPMQGNPLEEASLYIDKDKGLSFIDDIWAGARDIVAEIISENAKIRAAIREEFASEGVVGSKVIEGKDKEATKFELYYDFSEKVATIPSHRYLAIRRGEKEGILEFQISINMESAVSIVEKIGELKPASPYAKEFKRAIEESCKRLLLPSVETDIRVELKIKSDRAAIDIFAANLRHLLLAAPLGARSVVGIDPGLRTGSKCAATDSTGNYLNSVTLYLTQGERALQQAERDFLNFIAEYKPSALAIGNGTGGRETEGFVRKILSEHNLSDLIVVQVNEAGASVYSASECARDEFPDLDLTIRGAISIARRLQDPLAELVKIDPKAIGVGQYQHDVNQNLLQDKLSEVVESCVNGVGVEINTASDSLLSYVAGIGAGLAKKIVLHRQKKGPFHSRHELLEVSGFGPRTFEQAAGFLRVHGGRHPLDSSAVHPESYAIVEKMAENLNVPLQSLMGNHSLIQSINIKSYIEGNVGELTLRDIIAELQKPGRDPRASFEKPNFNDNVNTVADLKPGMKLEGVVTNVTAFGAFVDVGVHQDGLIHISELADHYVKDPSDVVKAGDRLKVTVLTIDVERKRIALSARQLPRDSLQPPSFHGQQKVQQKETKKNFTPGRSKQFGSNPFAGL